jgi:hypothetical protein
VLVLASFLPQRQRAAGSALDVDHHRRRGCAAGPSHGFAVTLDEAKAAFAETWRKWLALKGGATDQDARLVEKSKP